MMHAKFIEIPPLENCHKSGELWLEEHKNEESLPISAKIPSPIKSELFGIRTRNKRTPSLFGILSLVYIGSLMKLKWTEWCRE